MRALRRAHGRVHAARRCRASSWIVLVILSTIGLGCSAYDYDPVEEKDIEQLADEGCKDGDRVTLTAEVNQVNEDSLVLWDGVDPDTTYTVRFRDAGIARKTKGVFGKNRYESAYEALQDLKEDGEPIDVTLVCQGQRKTPIATRVSFRDEDGEEIAYEF